MTATKALDAPQLIALRLKRHQPRQVSIDRGRPAAVDQEHDGRLKTFGSVNGQDADFVTMLVHFPLDLGTGGFQCRQQVFEAGQADSFFGEAEREKLVEDLPA